MSRITEKNQILELKTTHEHSGLRLDRFISEAAQKDAHISRTQAKHLIENNCVWVDGKLSPKPSLVLSENQTVKIQIPSPKTLELTPQNVDFDLLYEDEHLAVLSKPVGISVHPSHTESTPTLVHGLLHRLKTLSSVGGVERPGIVHRIDKGTSGILVVSKTDLAHIHLSGQFKAHSVTRKYLALVYGDVGKKLHKTQGRIETFFGRSPKNRKKMTGKKTSGKKAITNWKINESFDGFTLLECQLETGKTHQIRVHLSELGFSIVGDPLYGDHKGKASAFDKKEPELSRLLKTLDHQLLHAYYLEFEHPKTTQTMKFTSPLPADFEEVLSTIRTALGARA